MAQSVATIDNPEFINLQPSDINPLMHDCEIKVLYVGQNRNRSYITKKVATEMSKSLRGAPIVGHYIEKKEDYGDHGERITIDSEGIKFEKLTKPYGFVKPDSKIWFQKFEDTDEFGNKTVREYLMAEGYLWDGQYQEAKSILTSGKGQSMELDDKTLKGTWSTDTNSGIEFFIINDAIFTKLCILGDDVEPCFEGASITAPEVSKNFSKESNTFMTSLFDMVSELKYSLSQKGGSIVDNENENFSNSLDDSSKLENSEIEKNTEGTTEFEKKEDKDKDSSENKNSDNESNENSNKEEKDDASSKDEDKKKEEKYSLIESELNALKTDFARLESENAELRKFKLEVETEQKDNLINSFYMLSDEDKKDVIAHKTEYSLKQIKAELAMICYDKKIDFSKASESEEEEVHEEKPITYSLDGNDGGDDLPPWLRVVDSMHNSQNN